MVDYEKMVNFGQEQALRNARRQMKSKNAGSGGDNQTKRLIDDTNEHLNHSSK